MSDLNPTVIVSIDGSYLIYYSLFGAVNKWIAASTLNAELLENVDQENLLKLTTKKDFTDLFEEQLIKRFETVYWILNTRIFKDIKFTEDPKIYLCLDSPLKDNWRMLLYPEYKQQRRVAKQQFNVRDAFAYGMDILLNKIDINKYFGIKVVKVSSAEGDDIIATINTKLDATYKFIIASDRDFLQLPCNVRQFNLEGKEVKPEEYKDMLPTGKQYLLSKILTGDTSDNIPQVFPRCGYKTAMKLVMNPNELKEKLKNDPTAMEQFKLNQKLIDFKNIPDVLTESILKEIGIDNLQVI
jgi:5'-3' exonuclease